MLLSDAAASFADGHRVARLATADATGAPHVVPVCYVRDGDRFYFVIDDKPKRGALQQLKRLRNIAANAQVALVIDDYDDDWRRLTYLLVRGLASIVEDARDYRRVLAALRARYPQYLAMPLDISTHPMVQISARRVHLWRAASPSSDA